MTSESDVIHDILLAFGARTDMKIWRNNTGEAHTKDRHVKFGLTGSADVCGVLLGGKAIFIEAKRPGGDRTKSGKKRKAGTQSDQQTNFQKIVEDLGAIYILAKSVDDVRTVITSLGFPP